MTLLPSTHTRTHPNSYARAYVTGGSWSPTRPGVYFAAQSDGALAAWDLFHTHNEPSLRVRARCHCY